ncbi:MAG: DUF3109 family protein [Bacteroidota bacterium]|nr:DUF3109 family protein [Rhodothermia bacterium]MCS7154371.1 DUF3109 family protein [Bacteroidota bacterium]MDW8137746.1 DUF3109 family protein [Bacteroidota bacterium]MDW8286404.1 DUF3109 family protein [Bacteroidota bacterium]
MHRQLGTVEVSLDVLRARFACDLPACRGACCVVGVGGAPLEPGELAALEAALPVLWGRLRAEAQREISREGLAEPDGAGWALRTTPEEGACVLAVFEDGIARCAVEQAYWEGRISFRKPLSCHLYPIRVESNGRREVLRYEQVPICEAGRRRGEREGVALIDFLQSALVRRWGLAWYERLRAVADATEEEAPC